MAAPATDSAAITAVAGRKPDATPAAEVRWPLNPKTADPVAPNRRTVYFNTGAGRLMKEWVATSRVDPTWAQLAREARAFVGGD